MHCRRREPKRRGWTPSCCWPMRRAWTAAGCSPTPRWASTRAALGLRLEDGRDFAPGDSADTPLVMIVSRSVATRLWPGRSPLGQQVRYAGAEGPQVTVVGVVDDVKFAVIGDLPGGHLYLPVRQHYRDWQTLVVHTRGDAATVLP